MARITLYNLGTQGIYKDIPSHLLPPEVWSDGNNMRLIDTFARRFAGHAQVFGTPSVVPGFIFNVPSSTDSYWVYMSLAAAYTYNAGVHTDITRAAGAYTAVNYRDWNGCLLAGVPIFNNGADVPQYWPTISAGTDLIALANWTSTLRAKVIRNFGSFLVAINLNDNGTLLPHAIQWSHPADPGTVPSSWDLTDPTKDAGRTHITDTKGGELVDGYLLGQNLILYKENSTHTLRFIGGNAIFSPDLLFEEGLIGHRCAAIIDGGQSHICLGQDNVFLHKGTKAVDYPLDLKDRRFLYATIDATNKRNSFIFDNPFFEEAWICFPASGATYPNMALVYNYRYHTCSFRDFDGLSADIGHFTDVLGPTWATITGTWDSITGPWQIQGDRRLLVASPLNTKIWNLDSGVIFGGATGTRSFLQRTGIAFGDKDRSGQPKADYSSRKLFGRIWPKIRGTASVSVRLGAQEELDGTVNWVTAKTFVPGDRYLDFEANGRFGAVEFSSLSDDNWQIEGYDLAYELLGEN